MITRCNEVKICKRLSRPIKEKLVVGEGLSVKQVEFDVAIKGDGFNEKELHRELEEFCDAHGLVLVSDLVSVEDMTAYYEEYLDDILDIKES